MKLLCMSDIHGDFYKTFWLDNLPDADAVLIAGDLTNLGIRRNTEMMGATKWLNDLVARYGAGNVFVISGNHDIGVKWWRVDGVVNLENRSAMIGPYKAFGVSMSPCYDMPELANVWCRMTASRPIERRAYAQIPKDTDIIISHSPPYGLCDETYDGRHIGSMELTKFIEENKPKFLVCGHCHESDGACMADGTLVVNTACLWTLIDTDEMSVWWGD